MPTQHPESRGQLRTLNSVQQQRHPLSQRASIVSLWQPCIYIFFKTEELLPYGRWWGADACLNRGFVPVFHRDDGTHRITVIPHMHSRPMLNVWAENSRMEAASSVACIFSGSWLQ